MSTMEKKDFIIINIPNIYNIPDIPNIPNIPNISNILNIPNIPHTTSQLYNTSYETRISMPIINNLNNNEIHDFYNDTNIENKENKIQLKFSYLKNIFSRNIFTSKNECLNV